MKELDKNRKIRVLMITSKFPRFKGDPQPPFTYDLSREIVNEGAEVYVIAPHDKEAKKEDFFDGIHVYRFKYFFTKMQKLAYGPGIPANLGTSWFTRFQMPFFAFSQFLFVKKMIKKINPDVVHVHWALPQGLSAMFTSIPYIVTIYGGEIFLSKNYKLMWLIEKIIKKSYKSFAITNGLRKLIYNFGIKSKIYIMPLGVDIKKFYPNIKGWKEIKKKFCKDNEFMILCVGRLVEKKGIHYLLPAFSDVLKKQPNCNLVIVGDGYMYDSLINQAKKLGINHKVTFTKEVNHSELPKYYCAADLFVLPSIIDTKGDRETQGVVYLEAMACKCPVVGTDTGGISDVISNKKTGVLVPEKDPKQLAEEIIILLKNDKLRKKYSEEGYKNTLKNFNWNDIAKRYLEIYKEILT